ncbi:MAG TPA: CBASS oligonucleotide cyclase [Nannocystis sp.]
MQTIAQAFETFLPRLELTTAERDNASNQHIYLREQLQQKMAVQDNFLSGSYARHTAVRPLNDIDVFLVLKPTGTLSSATPPDQVLTEVKRVLETIYSGKTARTQARSVNIEFSGTGIAYDVVPAFSSDDDTYTIPDAEASRWIRTNPRIHAAMSTEANERAGKKLKPLLKAVKQANQRRANPARSFHLEVLAWEVLDYDPGSYIDGLVTLLEGIAARVQRPCPDPARLGGDIRPSSPRCQEAASWFGEMAVLAREARKLAVDGRTGEAHARLREVLGEAWPEKGSVGARAAAVGVMGGSVDDPGSRFG